MSMLPIASMSTVRHHARGLLGRFRPQIVVMLMLYAGASAAALVNPWIVGQFVQHAVDKTLTASTISHLTMALGGARLSNTI